MKTWIFFLLATAATNAKANPELLSCVPSGAKTDLVRVDDNSRISSFENESLCEESRQASHGGVVCTYFTSPMPVGPGGWNENGWRPMNIRTKMGLGRRPLTTRAECLEATRTANGGVVCTNTGVGAKAANIETNMWCGASSQLKYCFEATKRAINHVVCSFPSSGTGAENGWVRTRVTNTCDYQTSQMSLEDCSDSIPPSEN